MPASETVIVEISEKRWGLQQSPNDRKIIGIITDGDLRRMLAKTDDFSQLCAKDIMSENQNRFNRCHGN